MAEELSYFEDLSVGIICPHEDCFVPDGEKLFYRVLKASPAVSEHFLPTELKEGRPLPQGFDDCIGKSVSIYDDLQGMINGFFKLPSHKGRKKHVGILQLQPADGRLKQTFDNKSHHSWWRSQTFDVATVTIQEITL